MKKKLNVLVIGSGGREHAIVQTCLKSDCVDCVIAAPGNGGMAQQVPCHALDIEDTSAIISLAKDKNIDFVIVGPEIPLAMGIIDRLEAEGITAYGPSQKAAQLEASKAFTKAFFSRHDIPTADAQTFTAVQPAIDYIHSHGLPIVIKASGLAAGKGVIIAHNLNEAEEAIRSMLEQNCFGENGHEIVIEEFLEGEEASIHAIVCGDQYILLPSSQDHKRIGENDTGPNTGGMGAYAPAPIVTQAVEKQVVETILKPTLAGLIKEKIDFRGTLYIGLMLTKNGPQTLEFNVRFGDPETQVILPLLKEDLIPLLYECAKGKLRTRKITMKKAFALIVVMASKGYPGPYPKGEAIQFPTKYSASTDIIHAGTHLREDKTIVSDGGRVLGVRGLGETLKQAAEQAYSLCKHISWPNSYYRHDIGVKGLDNRQ